MMRCLPIIHKVLPKGIQICAGYWLFSGIVFRTRRLRHKLYNEVIYDKKARLKNLGMEPYYY